jgi:hypothetical protein
VFEFLERLKSWRGDVVLVLDAAGRRCSFPVEWTDEAPLDAFVVAAEGSCPFRTEDLVKLAGLVGALGEAALRVSGDDVGGLAP